MKKKRIISLVASLLLISSTTVIFANANLDEQTGEQQVVPQTETEVPETVDAQVEEITPTAVGDTIESIFPDPNFAQQIANRFTGGDVNAVLTQTMADSYTRLDLNSDVTDITGVDVFVNLEEMYLGYGQLSSLPEGIGNLKKVWYLSAVSARLSILPESIGNMTSLQHLEIHANQLTRVPESIGTLSNLEALYLNLNQLTSLPESIGNLSNLKLLDVSENYSLTSIPESIGNLSSLQNLGLGGNQLTNIPETIGNLSNLTFLGLSDNQLTSLPESIGNLSSLENLFLSNNQLTSLPESIGRLSNLHNLSVSSNQLTHLPESLGNLSNLDNLFLNNNQLTSLPESFGNFTQLMSSFGNNLLPSGYLDYLEGLGFNGLDDVGFPLEYEPQSKLEIEVPPTVFAIQTQQDINNIGYGSFLGVQTPDDGLEPVAPTHHYKLENYVNENNQPININEYIKDGFVIKAGTLQAQVRATGTGLFPNNSDNAITSERITLELSVPSFQLTFDLQGADSESIPAQTVELGALAEKVKDPTKSDYTFTGWNTKADGSGTTWNFGTSTMPASSVVLYAQWEKSTGAPVDSAQPKTGDTTNLTPYIILGAVALIALAGLVLLGIKKSRKKKEDIEEKKEDTDNQ